MAPLMTVQCHQDIPSLLLMKLSGCHSHSHTVSPKKQKSCRDVPFRYRHPPQPLEGNLSKIHFPPSFFLFPPCLPLHISVAPPRFSRRLIGGGSDQIRSQQNDGSRNHLLENSPSLQSHQACTRWYPDKMREAFRSEPRGRRLSRIHSRINF